MTACEEGLVSCFLFASIVLFLAVSVAGGLDQAATRGGTTKTRIDQPDPNWEMVPCFNCALVTPACNRYC